MKKLLDLIKADLMIINGTKSSMKTMFFFLIVFAVGGGIFFSPLVMLLMMFMLAAMFVPFIFQMQSQSHCEKMFSILPIERKDLVRARFLFMIGLYVGLCAGMYLIMLLSLQLGIYESVQDVDYDKFLQEAGIAFSFFEICNLVFLAVFAVGMGLMTFQLRQYFRNTEQFADDALNHFSVKQLILVGLIWIVGVVIMLTAVGEIAIGATVSLLMQLFIQLITAADGALLVVVLFVIAGFEAAYQYICTVLEYDAKDL